MRHLVIGSWILLATVAAFWAASYGVLWASSRHCRPLRAALREYVAELWAVLSWPLALVTGRRFCSTRRGKRPVILLHGYGMNHASFLWLGRALARRGVGPIVAATYPWPLSVRSLALWLERVVERVAAREGADRVDVVGHSLGGLVARYYVARLGGGARVGRLITIGTPHQGTLWGHSGFGRSALDMRPGSDALRKLAIAPVPVPLTSIYSLQDNVVVPPRSGSVGAAGEDVVFDDLGHFGLLLSRRVADAVAARLVAAAAVEEEAPARQGAEVDALPSPG